MRETVAIVLNEREPEKEKAALELETRLKELNITSSRITISKNIERIILERRPKILVMDYLLGDFTTGLDVLAALQSLDYLERPKTIFFTDEQTIRVAVQAMRLGAVNYFELDNPQALTDLVTEIKRIVRTELSPRLDVTKGEIPSLDELVAESKEGVSFISRARLIAAKHPAITVIFGPKGSGKTATAHALSHAMKGDGYVGSVNLQTYTGSFKDFGIRLGATDSQFHLGTGHSMIVENIEADDGELLDLIRDRYLPKNSRAKTKSSLIVTTSSKETAERWQKILSAELLVIPSLAFRIDDIPPLVRRFVFEAEALSDQKIKPFPSDIIGWLESLSWPGEIHELRSVVIDGAVNSTFGNENLRSSIEDIKEVFESTQLNLNTISIDPLYAAITLERSSHNFRVAAARLGCPLTKLKEVLNNDAS